MRVPGLPPAQSSEPQPCPQPCALREEGLYLPLRGSLRDLDLPSSQGGKSV